MTVINGVINRVAPRTVVGINGAQYIEQNGIGARDYNKWRMSWNGNHLAPPESGDVLYLPGNPGFGSTIFDYSYNFNDSGIDTDEALDADETGIDCDADATTTIPVGSIIIIGTEWCKVTATGTTLTVLRGYPGTVATTHATNQDIRVWLPNNGTITGAVWTRLPSGLGVLNFDGIDDMVRFGDVCDVGTSDFTLLLWAKTTQAGISKYIINKNWSNPSWDLYLNLNKLRLHTNDNVGQNLTAISATSINDGVWRLLGGTFDRDGNMQTYVDGVADGTPVDMSLTATLNNPNDLAFGGQSDGVGGGANYFAGTLALGRLIMRVLSASEMANVFNQEKHLFGV